MCCVATFLRAHTYLFTFDPRNSTSFSADPPAMEGIFDKETDCCCNASYLIIYLQTT